MFNKKPEMMIDAVKIKLAVVEALIENIKEEDRQGLIYECRVAQKVILKEVLNELEMIKTGKAVVIKRPI